jgi:hypothetical protein
LYSDEEISYRDINWFGVDEGGRVANFTTDGGGVAPPLPARSDREANEMLEKVWAMPSASRIAHLDENRPANTKILQMEDYLRSFDAMAGRGMFAFDIWNRLDDGSAEYICAAAPTSAALSLESLPIGLVTSCTGNFALGVRVRVSADGLNARVVE